MEIAFTKMNGLGNDFVIIDSRDVPHTLTPEQVRILADRNHAQTGGCDQLLNLRPAQAGGAVFMEIYNADGSQVDACGNGTRAVAALLGLTHDIIETRAGHLVCTVDEAGMVSVEMGQPKLAAKDIPVSDLTINPQHIALHDNLPPALLVSMGNPHAVFFVPEDPQSYAREYGDALVHHSLFPEQANINFVTKLGDHHVTMATWERGAGLTKACGTGACASTVAFALQYGLATDQELQLDLPGGTLFIRYAPEDGGVFMRGPASFEFASRAML